MRSCRPGAAPSSMTCSFDVRLPLAKVFCAKLMTVLAAAAPGACTEDAGQRLTRQPAAAHAHLTRIMLFSGTLCSA